jgi:hypothetical protein
VSTTKPLDGNQRALNYLGQTERLDTPAQRRRKKHKYGHLAALERRLGRSGITKDASS